MATATHRTIIVGNLLALLRLESGATALWRASSSAVDIERVISPQRLAQLNGCIPDTDPTSVRLAMFQAAQIGQQACTTIANTHTWPQALAHQVLALLHPPTVSPQEMNQASK